MSPELALSLKTQAPALLRALRASYGIHTAPSTARKARALAPTVTAFRPGVYHVGGCIVDLWRMACTCAEAHARKCAGIQPGDKPCPHFIALYLAGEWSPIDPDPCLYLKSVGVEKPSIIAIYTHLRNRPGVYRVNFTHKDTTTGSGQIWVSVSPLNGGIGFFERVEKLVYLVPFYE